VRLLIVDDSPLIRQRLTAMLSSVDGVEVVGQAEDVQEAIERARCLRPDALILDLRLPSGSGLDVLHAVKRDDPAPLVMMVTALAGPEQRDACLAAGADFFFSKSRDIGQLMETVETYARGRGGTLRGAPRSACVAA
jgi:DNA-binding NarL/FixJ family response regulator